MSQKYLTIGMGCRIS